MNSSSKSKGDQRKTKSIRLDDIHWELLRGLIPFYGATESEVIRNIIVMWLHDNIGGKPIEKLEELGAIHIKTHKDM